jgi:membrane protease subunit (stomatin/prohibitin family)
MGLISAALGAAGGVLADQWKEYFYCEALPNDVLMVKGQKRVGKRSSNTKGTDNIISKGSVIAVADGQCMIIVDNGKVAEICAEPGEFVYDSSTEPSIFAGNLGEGILDSFKEFGRRFGFGGEPAKDQRVYYVNTKQVLGNKYGTPNSIAFRVVDQRARIDMDIGIKCFGEYVFKIVDPVLFYTNVAANVTEQYARAEIEGQMREDLLHALQPAFAVLSEKGIRYSALMGHTDDMAEILNQKLSSKWGDQYGIKLVSIAIASLKANEEDEKKIKQMQERASYTDPSMRDAMMATSMANAMETAAGNSAGAATGFMGMGMMGGMMGGYQFQQQPQQGYAQQQPQQTQQQVPAAAAGGWKCPKCGAQASGKFCPECGAPKPEATAGWTCSCGTVNQGKFCQNCGAKKPAGAPLYKCDKCGWVPPDPHNPPKFCPECGDVFDDSDVQQ